MAIMSYSNASSELHIRAITTNDYPALKRFANCLLREHVHLTVTKSKIAKFVEKSNQIMLIAEIRGELVGVISAKKPSATPQACYWLELFVGSNWRKKGIGKNLLQSLLIKCHLNKKIQCLSLSVKRNNKIAIELYLKHGFKKKFNFTSLFSPVIDMELNINSKKSIFEESN